jgi:hypothetical protein
MYIGVEAGFQLVPEPIWPIGIRLCSLAPTRMLISVSDMTIKGPIFIRPMSCPLMPSAPFIASWSWPLMPVWLVAPGSFWSDFKVSVTGV